ncbi:hypothetical protein CGC21_0365 [Leishmania donovani]|uniref:Uncharacterized protein n=1 Tax=Leishmania donovani TaxID=5661 RepID=A0A504XSU2_LEIDO|nr:hypothetical protein CGC21_0365 [Leishmania donovani]
MLRNSTVRWVWLGGSGSSPALGLDLRSPAGQFVNVVPEGMQPRRMAGHFNPTPQANSLAATHYAHAPELRHMADGAAMSLSGQRIPLLKPTLSNGTAAAGERLPPGVYHASSGLSSASPDAPAYYAVAGRDSAVGYAPPLGPADPVDVIPFFVHRSSNGHLPGKVYSMNAKTLMPAFYMRIQNIEGDMFRFEEELMKIFPTKKIFVRSHSVYVYNVNLDGRAVLHHWLLGLGF